MYFASTSEDILLDLDDDVELPMAVRQELARQRAKVYVTLARFDEAWETLENITSWDEDPHPHLLPALKALIHLGRGEFNEAIRIVVSDFLKARGEVSMRSIKSSGNVLALLLLVRGQHAPLESLSETVLDPGREPHFPLTPTLGVVCCVACNSNNDASVVQDYLAQAKSIQVPDGPFPGMTRSWPEARLKALRGSQHEAAGIMWDSALRSMELGRVFAACTDAVASLELHYDSARMNLLDGWLESVRSPFIEGMVSYLKAVHREDAQCILDAAPRLAAGGRVAHALKAYEIAGELFAEQGRMDKASEANELLRDYESILEPGAIDAHRTSKPQSSPLTSRERDVVELVAEGLTNQVIARKLVLSVRTVENHIHRAMRKTGTTTRQELGRSVIAM